MQDIETDGNGVDRQKVFKLKLLFITTLHWT